MLSMMYLIIEKLLSTCELENFAANDQILIISSGQAVEMAA